MSLCPTAPASGGGGCAPWARFVLVGGCLGSRTCLGKWGGWLSVHPLRSGLDNFAVCCRNIAACVVDVASDHIVGEVGLQHNVLGVHMHLEDVVPGLHVSDVNPLAVDVRVVSVIAAWAQALGKGTRVEVGCCILLRAWGLLPVLRPTPAQAAARNGAAPASAHRWPRGIK